MININNMIKWLERFEGNNYELEVCDSIIDLLKRMQDVELPDEPSHTTDCIGQNMFTWQCICEFDARKSAHIRELRQSAAAQIAALKEEHEQFKVDGGKAIQFNKDRADRAEDENAKLTERLRAAEKDSERLDAIESMWPNGIHIESCATGNMSIGIKRTCTVFTSNNEYRDKTIRAAIDAALSAREGEIVTTQTEKRRERAKELYDETRDGKSIRPDRIVAAMLTFAAEIEREAIDRCEEVCQWFYSIEGIAQKCAEAIAKLKEQK